MRKAALCRSIRLPVLLVCLSAIGCKADGINPHDTTLYKLMLLGEVAKQFSENEVDCHQFTSLAEYLAEARKANFITEEDYERGYYERDGWGRPFRYETRSAGKKQLILVKSHGDNGVWENGKGDDLSIQIESINGQLGYRTKPSQ